MATANMKDVKRRIKSVESTMQITKAMQLVAASKLRRAKDKAVAVQPFFETLFKTMCDISCDRAFKSVYTKKKFLNSTLLIVVAGDRGLAGGFTRRALPPTSRLPAKRSSVLPPRCGTLSRPSSRAIPFC